MCIFVRKYIFEKSSNAFKIFKKLIYIAEYIICKNLIFVDPKNVNWRREDINAVSPLLEAYQTSLEEKDVTIESYKNELARFSSRSREIAAENENLYQQLEEANEKVKL